MSTGLDSASRSVALVSEDLSSLALPACVEPHKKLIDWAMNLCQLWSVPQLATHHLMTGPNEPSDPWEDFHMDAIERFYTNDDFESDDSWDSTPPEPVSHAPPSSQIRAVAPNKAAASFQSIHRHSKQPSELCHFLLTQIPVHCVSVGSPLTRTLVPLFPAIAALCQFEFKGMLKRAAKD